MKILLFGKDGQLGRALLARLQHVGDILACSRDVANFEEPENIERLLIAERPDVIINAAAYTVVDAAEHDVGRAEVVNCRAVKIIAKVAKEIGALLIHYSTDYVFDGNKAGLYSETDAPNPLNVYGRTKLDGDKAVVAAGGEHIIFRTSWVYGLDGKNFANTILNLAQCRESLKIVADQIGAPTSTRLIADITERAIRERGDLSSGLYNLAPKGVVSWHGFACFLVREAAAAGAILTVDADHIHPISSDDYGAQALRPLNSALDCAKIEQTFRINLPDWQDDARSFVQEWAKRHKV